VRLVCDTNVLIAGLVADGLCRDIVKRRLPRHEIFTSKALLAELEEKLRQKFGVDPGDVPFLALYRARANIIDAAPLAEPICRDHDDDEVLAVAIASRSDAIVTGDKDLLILKSHAGIPILSPRQLVELMDQGK
jgi:putative PIN family toxin of toxin-antitoxin system